MGIFDRPMGKVISSNVNALLDKAEDPKKNIDLIVEEMKDQIRPRARSWSRPSPPRRCSARRSRISTPRWRSGSAAPSWRSRPNDEKLAREALVQKKRVVGERDRAESLRAEQRSTVLTMKGELERMEAKQQGARGEEGDARRAAQAGARRRRRRGPRGEVARAARSPSSAAWKTRSTARWPRSPRTREVDDAMTGRAHGGRRARVEVRGARRQDGLAGDLEDRDDAPRSIDELAALKKKIRIG
jgi:phage shock protein A